MDLGKRVCIAAAALAGSAAARAQLLSGTFDELPVGTAPDNNTPAGAWYFPSSYPSNWIEVIPSNFTIVPTDSFGSGPGNSLALGYSGGGSGSIALPNIFAAPVLEAPGRIIRITLRAWVRQPGVSGGYFFAGADMGGGGYTNTTDRGPQIQWRPDATLVYYTNATTYATLVPAYPVGQWQNVRLDIRLDTDTWDCWWSVGSQPLTEVGLGLPFRSGPLPRLDRVTFAQLGPSTNSWAYFDDVTLQVIDPPPCYADCDGSGGLSVADFICFQTKFALGEPYADCNEDGVRTVSDYLCFQARFAMGC